jgi:hypothetical protein
MKKSYLVVAISLLIAGALILSTKGIRFWPTDSELAYIPAATQVFSTPFISDLHRSTLLRYNIMHGKETLVVGIAVAQRILNDYESLFPNILVLILAAMGSGILIFLILRRWLNEATAFWGFLFFVTTFWTYQYVIQGAHQPLVMFNFLLTGYALLEANGQRRIYICAGIALGLMLFSSPTAAVYFPYLAALYFLGQNQLKGNAPLIKKLMPIPWIMAGTVTIILAFTLPNVGENFRDFLLFLRDSRQGNHFQVIEKLTGEELPLRGAGAVWIFKYMTLIMPVLFGAYIVSLLYLGKEALKKKSIWIVIALSLSTPVGVELIQVAQFGRNYFSWLIGILLACAYALYHFERTPATPARHRQIWKVLLVVIFGLHGAFNAWAFLGDILPSRMAATYMHDWLIRHPGEKHAYLLHPHNINTVHVINHPLAKDPIRFNRLASIAQAKDGYIVVPMETGKSIYRNCASPDFREDPELLKLIESGEYQRFVVAGFPTMASSHFWPQEEEYCSYLDLIESGITDRDRDLGYAWILDADKLQKEWFKK